MKVRVKVPSGRTEYGRLEAYMRIVHQHLRYADVIGISEFPPEEKELPKENDPIEFTIEVDEGWAKEVITRIRSFNDFAEVVE